jgi:hypothetical protein
MHILILLRSFILEGGRTDGHVKKLHVVVTLSFCIYTVEGRPEIFMNHEKCLLSTQ